MGRTKRCTSEIQEERALKVATMRDLQELKLNDAGAPVITAPPTKQQLAYLEHLVGAPLPPAYVEFLQFSNGGHPQLNSFFIEVRAEGYREQWSVDNFFSISSDDPDVEDTDEVLWRYNHRNDTLTQEFLPIADNGIGDTIYLDLTREGHGRVVLCARERPAWARGALPASDVLLPIAASFEEFIDLLTLNPDLEEQ